MRFVLPDGISWCICAGRAVFLDLNRDRYFCLAPPDDAAFRRWATSGNEFEPQMIERLAAKGVLRPGEGQRTPPAHVEPAVRDLATAGGKARISDLGYALAGQIHSRWSVRRGSLADILRPLHRFSPSCGPVRQDIPDKAQRIASAFEASALVLRKADQCLSRALAARALCARRGVPCALVFGIRLEPFAAHCWVQWEDAVVVGGLEEVRMFTPILVVS